MKCENCGADYGADEKCCPYCLTPNSYVQEFTQEKEEATKVYETVKNTRLPQLRKEAASRILNKILIAEGILIALYFVGFIIFAVAQVGGKSLRNSLKREAITEQLQQAYQDEDFALLYHILQKYELFNEDGYDEYADMAFLYFDYENFREARSEFYTDGGSQYYDENDIYYALSNINRLVNESPDTSTQLGESNAEYARQYRNECIAFAIGSLKLTNEELETVLSPRRNYQELEAVAANVCEREPWK